MIISLNTRVIIANISIRFAPRRGSDFIENAIFTSAVQGVGRRRSCGRSGRRPTQMCRRSGDCGAYGWAAAGAGADLRSAPGPGAGAVARMQERPEAAISAELTAIESAGRRTQMRTGGRGMRPWLIADDR